MRVDDSAQPSILRGGSHALGWIATAVMGMAALWTFISH